MKKWYSVNGKNQLLGDNEAATLKSLGCDVESAKSEINQKRTAFERLAAPNFKGFYYLLDLESMGNVAYMTFSTSLVQLKRMAYAMIQDQIDNVCDEFSVPEINFFEKSGSGLLFSMKLVKNLETNEFEWVQSFLAKGVEIPDETETSLEETAPADVVE